MRNRIARYQGCDDKTMFLLERDNDVLWYCAKNNLLTLCFGSPDKDFECKGAGYDK